MRRKCTNVGVIEDVRQLDGISGRGGDVHQGGRNEFAAYIIREGRNNWKGLGQDARVGVCNTKEKARCQRTC